MGIAIFNGVGAIGGFAGPYVVGSLVEQGGYDKCMYVLGALFAALGALILSAPFLLPLCCCVTTLATKVSMTSACMCWACSLPFWTLILHRRPALLPLLLQAPCHAIMCGIILCGLCATVFRCCRNLAAPSQVPSCLP